MDLRTALKEQYHAGLRMLSQCVERCPERLWSASNPPEPSAPDPNNPGWNGVERSFWRIAFHDVYFTHLYLGQDESAFLGPPSSLAVRRRQEFDRMWQPPWDLEPYELFPGTAPSSRADICEYVAFVDGLVDDTVDGLDLDSDESGFPWYPAISKLSHELLNLRHLQGHVGQLSELLMLHGIDVDWTGT